MAKRYEQIIDVIRQVKPKSIVEVGVHKGLRSALMCREALKFQERLSYVGLDVFETEDADFHLAALNGKGMPSEAQAAERLRAIGPALTWQFIKGDTRSTLHGKSLASDLVFIDGDHRTEVIAGDYEALKSARCVIADDYYSGNLSRVDLKKYGCNRLVNSLHDAGAKVELLPVRDTTVVGAYTQLAVIWASA